MDFLQAHAIIEFVERKIWDQQRFFEMADERRKALDISKEAFARAAGRAPSAYAVWEKGKERLSIDAVLGICELLKIRPAWALFGVGPKTDEEEKVLQDVRDVIAGLRAYASLDAAPAEYAPSPHLKSEVEAVSLMLGRVLGETEVELPERVWTALESVATLLRQLDAPQVVLCRMAQREEASGKSEDGALNGG